MSTPNKVAYIVIMFIVVWITVVASVQLLPKDIAYYAVTDNVHKQSNVFGVVHSSVWKNSRWLTLYLPDSNTAEKGQYVLLRDDNSNDRIIARGWYIKKYEHSGTTKLIVYTPSEYLTRYICMYEVNKSGPNPILTYAINDINYKMIPMLAVLYMTLFGAYGVIVDAASTVRRAMSRAFSSRFVRSSSQSVLIQDRIYGFFTRYISRNEIRAFLVIMTVVIVLSNVHDYMLYKQDYMHKYMYVGAPLILTALLISCISIGIVGRIGMRLYLVLSVAFVFKYMQIIAPFQQVQNNPDLNLLVIVVESLIFIVVGGLIITKSRVIAPRLQHYGYMSCLLVNYLLCESLRYVIKL